MSAAGCLSDETVLEFAQGRLPESDVTALEEHVRGCADCRALVAEAAKFFFQEAAARYTIAEPMGAGGAGVVYRAYDPRLERPVALKVLRTTRARAQRANPSAFRFPTEPGEEETSRLLREAQAMARLSHPNVVTVYDAYVDQGRVCIVMELVEGTTLAAWLRERAGESPERWQEIVEVFLDAGRGLVAAHAAGLVHRDFKPDNVLVGADGRARVTDFGLAAPAGNAAAAAGTPRYMAPEQFAGKAADARSDQFAFCVALYTALYGQPPWQAESVEDLAKEVRAGRLRPPPAGTEVPAQVHAALSRGLDADPESRFPTMAALLDELARARPLEGEQSERARALPRSQRSRRSTLFLAAIAAAIALAAAGLGALYRATQRRSTAALARPACEAGEARFLWPTNGHCYSRHDRPLGWEAALRACRDIGGYLVTYNSAPEVTAVFRGLLASGAPDDAYWGGLHDERGDGHYGWITNEPFDPIYRAGDLTAAPLGRERSERTRVLSDPEQPPGRCVAQRPAIVPELAQRIPWRLADCAAAAGFVCESPGWVVRPLDGHAYKAFYREKTWAGAREACSHLGAYLATIADADENAFVSSAFFATAWIGGTRARGTFRWIRSETWSFQLFGEGEPDVPARVPACVVIGADRRWHDRPCDGSAGGPHAFICEME